MDWGYIEAPDAYAEKILRIVADLHRKTTKETARDSNTSRRRISKPIKIAIAVVPVLALIVAYVAAVASNPVYKSYFYYNLGVTWAKIGRYDVAISKYSKALELNPRLSFAYGNRGAAWARQGEYDKAVADYDMVLEIEPKNPRAYYNRAFYLSKEGNHDRAIADYSKAIELYPRYEYAYVNRGLSGLRWQLAMLSLTIA